MSDRPLDDGDPSYWREAERLSPERAVRLLRAKAAEMEAWVLSRSDNGLDSDVVGIAADVALIAALLADHIERTDTA